MMSENVKLIVKELSEDDNEFQGMLAETDGYFNHQVPWDNISAKGQEAIVAVLMAEDITKEDILPTIYML